MNKEYIFFAKYNLTSLNIISTIKYIYRKIINFLKKRMSKIRYPKKYQYLRQTDFITDRIKDDDISSDIDRYTYKDDDKIDLEMILSTEIFHIHLYKDIFQKQNFNDPEDYESLHRFLWIRYYLSKEYINPIEINKIESLIIYWCKSSQNNDYRVKDKLIWEPYTVSERIINIIFFYNKIKKDMPIIIQSQLDKMTNHVIKNLEFYNSSYGNHLINNFRGILFYSITFENNKLINVFSDLMNIYLEDFIEDGFTKDFSSHYQLLFYFWLYDLLELAKAKSQRQLLILINKYIESLYERSIFFYSNKSKHYSLFGDISPDLPPKYLISLLDRDYFYNDQYSVLRLYQDNRNVG